MRIRWIIMVALLFLTGCRATHTVTTEIHIEQTNIIAPEEVPMSAKMQYSCKW